MESQSPLSHCNLLDRLQGLLKTSVGGLVIASATVATTPAPVEASTSSPTNRPTISQRVAEVRKQAAPAATHADSSVADSLLAWGNWNNWRNGWPNGWHNWHNWRNWGNY